MTAAVDEAPAPLTEEELAWKIEGTRGYQELTRRGTASMTTAAPLAAPEANRRRIDVGELLPLSVLKARTR